jgi:hypothetical protein
VTTLSIALANVTLIYNGRYTSDMLSGTLWRARTFNDRFNKDMKNTIEFNLPEERIICDIYHKAPKMYEALFDITHNLRKRVESIGDLDEYQEFAILDIMIDEINEILKENSLSHNDFED